MSKNKRYIIIVLIIVAICGISIFYIIKKNGSNERQVVDNTPATVAPTVEPTEKPKVMLPELVDYYNKNQDLIGWLKIDGTPIDNPVMFIEGDNDFYLKRDFDKKDSIYGTLYIDGASKISTPNTNIIIYGHNMKNQTMFGSLKQYRNKSYYDAHPTITFNTLYERGEYEIFGAFYAQVLKKSDTTSYRYYQFFEATTEDEFNEFVQYVEKVRQYDTGVRPQYGDQLITLSTCSSHVDNGRFAVVARRITTEENVDNNTNQNTITDANTSNENTVQN